MVKPPAGIAVLAKRYDIPCFAIAGTIGKDIEKLYDLGITSIFSICKGSVQESIRNAKKNIPNTVEQVIRTFILTNAPALNVKLK